MAVATPPSNQSVAISGDVRAQLATLAASGTHCLRQWRLRTAVRSAAAWMLLWLPAGPAILVAIRLLGHFSGISTPHLSVATLVISALAGPLGYFLVRVISGYSRFKPTRATALALHDRRFENQDRLVTADEFLSSSELEADTVSSAFMRAAVEDSRESIRWALANPLSPIPVPPLRVEPRSLLGILAAALVVWLAIGIGSLLPERPGAGDGSLANSRAENIPPEVAKEAAQASHLHAKPKNEAQPVEPPVASPPPAAASPMRQPPRKNDATAGQPGAGGGSQASSSTAMTKAAGMASNQKNSPKPPKPEAPKAPEDDDQNSSEGPAKKPKPHKPETGQMAADANSGQGKSSSASGTQTPYESVEEPDKTGQGLKTEAEDQSAEDEDEEEKTNGVTKPLGETKDPAVDRNLSNQPPGNGPPQNGRGGPGEVKKTRGVPTMILGIPVPDRVPGTPNPGRSKLAQEFTRPKEEANAPLEAQSRDPRTGVIGPVEQPDLVPWRRALIEDYFLTEREQPAPDANPAN